MAGGFNDHATYLVRLARKKAKQAGRTRVQPLHLLGSLLETASMAGRIMDCLSESDHNQDKRNPVHVFELEPEDDDLVPFAEEMAAILSAARDEARSLDDALIAPEHLLLGILRHGDNEAALTLEAKGIVMQPVRQALLHLRNEHSVDQIRDIVERSSDGTIMVLTPTMWTLKDLCLSATQACFNGFLEGTTSTTVREPEVRRILQVLSRNTRNNIVLIGESGVGKSVVLRDVARCFASGQVTDTLRDKEPFWVEWDRLQTMSSNPAPYWLNYCLDRAAHQGVILFLDDVAEHVDFGSRLGTDGPETSLWRHLSNKTMQVVMTMKPSEYAKFANESPLHRHFEPVRIPELSTEQTITVLNEVIRQRLSTHHAVSIADEAIPTAADLANRYIPDQFLPAKAVTLLDEACANVQTARLDVDRVRLKFEAMDKAIHDFDGAGSEPESPEHQLNRALYVRQWTEEHAPELNAAYSRDLGLVDDEAVRRTLAELKGIPVQELRVPDSTEPSPQPSDLTTPAATRLPNRLTSTAVLLGAAHYAHDAIPDTPAITNNLLSLNRRLTDVEHGSFSPDRVHQPTTDLDTPHIPAIVEATRAATDTLLVYYSGHGLIADDGQLYLGLATTDPELWEYTALPYDKLRKAVHDAPARNKILILDCCFAGRAIDDLSDPGRSSGQLDIEGTYVLTATTATRTAHASDGADHTAFTGALLGVLSEGVDEREELIRLSDIYSRLDRRLIAKGLPKPQQRGTNNIHNLALTRNPRWNRTLAA
ncbi:Clp domain protein [Stackebrandtia nassauensis DSM 44728]|uniref:Clp domain protein n=1 Tax=Stackebrandtia nassauensis (strain DSM 44728 / CIP 108903 / NRRL B-16338 / NBRC 102104 / LLR-40K-21) TaxID=446470 RepID=D3Q4B9_STANL|nr:Clp domain protein [Stackebrandtia nassauensis DSM 44728]